VRISAADNGVAAACGGSGAAGGGGRRGARREMLPIVARPAAIFQASNIGARLAWRVMAANETLNEHGVWARGK